MTYYVIINNQAVIIEIAASLTSLRVSDIYSGSLNSVQFKGKEGFYSPAPHFESLEDAVRDCLNRESNR